MEMKPGYKQTEVGVIPKDWTLSPLAEFMQFQNGVNADKSDYGKGIPFANVLEVITKSHLCADDIPGLVRLSRSQAAAYEVKKGDILFNRTSETQEEIGLASVYTSENPVVFGGFVIRGRTAPGSLNIAFSGYGLRAPIVRQQIIARGQGAIRANIGQADLRTVLAPLPSIPEQQAIAEALSDADALIESLEKLVAKKRDIKQAAMQELLTGKRRLPGFAGAWAEMAIGEVFDFRATATNARADLSADAGNAYYIHYGDIHTQFETHIDFREADFPMIDRQKCPHAELVKNGDWIVVDASEDYEGVAKAVEVSGLPDDAAAVSGLHTFLLREKRPTFAAGFKGYLRQSPPLQRQLLRLATGMKVFGVSKTAFRDVRIPVPDWREQVTLVDVLSSFTSEIRSLETLLEKARQLKQGMMQELLTGRIRLT